MNPTHRALASIFADTFDLQPCEASVLGALYLARDKPVPPVGLAERANVSPASIYVHLHHLRKQVADGAIERLGRDGYRLTHVGAAKCRSVLEETRLALAEAA